MQQAVPAAVAEATVRESSAQVDQEGGGGTHDHMEMEGSGPQGSGVVEDQDVVEPYVVHMQEAWR